MGPTVNARRARAIDASGQAAIETILLSFVLITFVAAGYQMFYVNQTIYKSLTAVHQMVFERAFERNRCGKCDYQGDLTVVWSPVQVPEITIPVVGMFGKYGLGEGELRLWSKRASPERCPGLPCKSTRIGAGTHMNPIDGLLFLSHAKVVGIDGGQLVNSLGWIARVLPALQ